MKVLLALQQLSGDGVSRFALDLGAQLETLGARVKLFVYRAPDGVPVPHGDVQIPVIRGQEPERRRRYWAPVLISRLLTAAAAADVVLAAQEGGEGAAAAFLAAKLTLTPIAIVVQANVAESFAISGGWTVPVLKYAYPHFDRLICVSEGVRDTAMGMGAHADRLTVIPNGIDVERVRRLASQPAPGWLPTEPYLVGVGRLESQKGYDVLLRAFARAREAGLEQRLVIVGEGTQRTELEALVTELRLGDSVLLPGYTENPFPVVAGASAFCLSSRYEGSPLVLAEALTLGRPVIATDCISGPREILRDGEFGRLVDTGSVDALAEALLDHASDPGALARRAATAASQAERFSVEASARAYTHELGLLAPRAARSVATVSPD